MPVPQDPTIVIRFAGLLVFCFDKRFNHCQIGVHSKTDDHELRLRFIKKGPDLESQSEQTLTIGHALIRQSADFWLDVEGEHSSEPRTAEPFIVGKWNEPPTDPQDFRRVVDLESDLFYNRPLKVRRGVLRPILFITQGLFYTSTLTSVSYLAVPVASNRTGRRPQRSMMAVGAMGRSLGRIAEYVGANFYFTHPNQALVLRAGRSGSELLRLEGEGATYEITIENGDMPHAPAGGDFDYYYDAFELNCGEPKILLEPYGLPSMGSKQTGCCECVWLSKSDGLVFD